MMTQDVNSLYSVETYLQLFTRLRFTIHDKERLIQVSSYKTLPNSNSKLTQKTRLKRRHSTQLAYVLAYIRPTAAYQAGPTSQPINTDIQLHPQKYGTPTTS